VRVILDTNILVAALISPSGPPAAILQAFLDERFALATCGPQLEAFRRVTREPALRKRVKRSEIGTLVNELRALAIIPKRLAAVARSRDPHDDFLLALAEAAGADYLVTGDKSGLLILRKHRRTQIGTARRFATLLGD
jgi:putative PIN family toxin of toxin-antitoxin system